MSFAIKKNRGHIIQMMQFCMERNDAAEAAYWARIYEIPTNEIKNIVRNSDAVLRAMNIGSQRIERNKPEPGKFYEWPQHISVIWVSTNAEFEEMLKHLASHNLIGFDTENIMFLNVLGLIQLATTERAYLVSTLNENISDSNWHNLGAQIFNTNDRTIIGESGIKKQNGW